MTCTNLWCALPLYCLEAASSRSRSGCTDGVTEPSQLWPWLSQELWCAGRVDVPRCWVGTYRSDRCKLGGERTKTTSGLIWGDAARPDFYDFALDWNRQMIKQCAIDLPRRPVLLNAVNCSTCDVPSSSEHDQLPRPAYWYSKSILVFNAIIPR
jgi:hypothetical protein